MKSSVTKTFRKRLSELPTLVQEQAAKTYALWKEDPYHPSLQFKPQTGIFELLARVLTL
jgi:hypothetical protein